MQRPLLLMFIFTLLLCGADKQRVWKTGKVLDSATSQSTYATGAITNTNATATAIGTADTATATGHSTSTTSIQHVTVRENELLIAGEDYVYLISDDRRKGGPILATALHNRHHGCRFVVGEDIKYSQDKGDLYVIDADQKECKTAILRQEKKQ